MHLPKPESLLLLDPFAKVLHLNGMLLRDQGTQQMRAVSYLGLLLNSRVYIEPRPNCQ